MSGREPIDLDPHSKADASPNRNCGVQWALPVDARLESLVERARLAGERTNRREMLSAILCDFEASDEAVGTMLRSYRLKTVATVVGEQDEAKVISIQRYGPGPRRT